MASKYPSESELIVVAKPEAALRAAAPGTHMGSVAPTNVAPLNRILKTYAATIRPLFGASEDRLMLESLEAAPEGPPTPNLSVYYRVKAPEQQLHAIAKELREHEAVEAAYVKPPAQPPLNEMAPAAVEAPPATPNFTSRQIYLDAAPGGIDARHAWTLRGGRGEGVRIIDIEGAWRFSHEDLTQNQGGVVGGTPSTDIGWRNHGHNRHLPRSECERNFHLRGHGLGPSNQKCSQPFTARSHHSLGVASSWPAPQF